jgi:hypothetical protein
MRDGGRLWGHSPELRHDISAAKGKTGMPRHHNRVVRGLWRVSCNRGKGVNDVTNDQTHS